MQLAVALSHAKIGHEGDAWRSWDEADRAAQALPNGYVHPWLLFGRGMVDAYAITMNTNLVQSRDAIRAADRLDLSACLLYTSPSPRDRTRSRMPSSA